MDDKIKYCAAVAIVILIIAFFIWDRDIEISENAFRVAAVAIIATGGILFYNERMSKKSYQDLADSDRLINSLKFSKEYWDSEYGTELKVRYSGEKVFGNGDNSTSIFGHLFQPTDSRKTNYVWIAVKYENNRPKFHTVTDIVNLTEFSHEEINNLILKMWDLVSRDYGGAPVKGADPDKDIRMVREKSRYNRTTNVHHLSGQKETSPLDAGEEAHG